MLVQSGEIFQNSDARDRKIKGAIKQGIKSVGGGAEIEQPKSMRKDVVRRINELLHPWKDISLLYALSLLRPQYGQPSQPTVAERVKALLDTSSFLQASPGEDYFTARTFHQLILNRVFESKPELWVHIDVNAPHEAFDNLFALGAAAIAANIRNYQLGEQRTQEVSVDNWVLDYKEACQLLTVI